MSGEGNSMSDEKALVRPSVKAMDAMLGRAIRVLDDGFVRIVDYMGSDDSIVQAARVSYGDGTKRVSEDRGLIRYLMRHRHTTPFEMCEIKLHVRVPMDCWRQWIRHRTANVNEYSTRYSVAIDAAQRTAPDRWRLQAQANKQGSAGTLPLDDGRLLSDAEGRLLEASRAVYEERLAAGVAREQARKDLPLSTYTEAYWKCDLHNLMHFLSLRMDSRAQEEIRAYALVIGNEIMSQWCPIAWEAFQDYRLGGVHLSSAEVEIIGALARSDMPAALECARAAGLVPRQGPLGKSRERDELAEKLRALGFTPPWVSTTNGDT
jgi:thymidylate synthase (FAD)